MTSFKIILSLSLAALVLLVTTANARPSSESNSGESMSIESASLESLSTESMESNETMQEPVDPPVVGGPVVPNTEVLPLVLSQQRGRPSGRRIIEEGATSSSEESTENEESTESEESPESPETPDESEPVDPVDPIEPVNPEVVLPLRRGQRQRQRQQNREDDSSSSQSASEESEEDDDIEGLPVCTIMNVANEESQNRPCPPFHECDPFPTIPLENGEGMTVYRIGVCRRTSASDIQFLASVDCNPDDGACQTFRSFDRGVYQEISLPGGDLTFETFDELEPAIPPTDPVAP